MTGRRRALVTGASRRVGLAIAEELARDGYDLALHTRSSSPDDARRACEAAGATVLTVQADLSTVQGCRHLVDRVLEQWDSLDVLVNNASLFEAVPFHQITADGWDRMLAVNLRGPFLLSQGFASALSAAEGLVVHMTDIGGQRPVVGYTHYSVSKAGLIMLVRAMAVELAPAIRTVGISPGHVVWPDGFTSEQRTRIAARIPMKRVGEAADVAALIRFLAREGHYINGAVIPVDGGLSSRY